MALVVSSVLVSGCGAVHSVTSGTHTYTDNGSSMEPTIHKGQAFDVRPVSAGSYTPRRGDVVVFTMPSWLNGGSTPLVKRVIAIEGDKVSCDGGGAVVLNGTPLKEPYIKPGDQPCTASFSVVVPRGRLWLMGDARAISADSRYHLDIDSGTVPASAVVGVAVLA